MKFVIIFVLFVWQTFAWSEEMESPRPESNVRWVADLPYDTPGAFEWVTSFPENLWSFGSRIKPIENIEWTVGLTASSLLFIYYDQEITHGSQRVARQLGLISNTKTGRETYTLIDWRPFGYSLGVELPLNTNSAMYFLGDGLAHLGVVSGLLGYGFITDDKRSVSTASQTVEALLLTGVVVQVLKRTAGREAPFLATQVGGKWQWLPDQDEYNQHVPRFDAFPSGHLATVMATTTVLAENYPEHRYIWPVGSAAMVLLSFAMLNNGVHWAGDYPVAIGVGYLAAEVAVDRNRKKREALVLEKSVEKSELRYLPFYSDGVAGAQFLYRF